MDIEDIIIKNPIKSTIFFLMSMGVDNVTVKNIVGNDNFLLLYELEIDKIKPYIKSVNLENIINSLDGQSPSNYLTNGGGTPDEISELRSDPKDRYIRNIIWSTFWFFKLIRAYMSYDNNTIITSVFEIIMKLYLVMDVFVFGLNKLKLQMGQKITTIEGKSDMMSNALAYLNSRTKLPDNYTAEKAKADLTSMIELQHSNKISERMFLSELTNHIIDEKEDLEEQKNEIEPNLEEQKKSIVDELKKKDERNEKRGKVGNMIKMIARAKQYILNKKSRKEILEIELKNLETFAKEVILTHDEMSKFFENQLIQHNSGDLLSVERPELNEYEMIAPTIKRYNKLLDKRQKNFQKKKEKSEVVERILLPPMEIMKAIMVNVKEHGLNPFIFKICIAISKMLEIVKIYQQSLQNVKNLPIEHIFIFFFSLNLIVTSVEQSHNGGKRKSRRKTKNMRRKSRRVRKNKD